VFAVRDVVRLLVSESFDNICESLITFANIVVLELVRASQVNKTESSDCLLACLSVVRLDNNSEEDMGCFGCAL